MDESNGMRKLHDDDDDDGDVHPRLALRVSGWVDRAVGKTTPIKNQSVCERTSKGRQAAFAFVLVDRSSSHRLYSRRHRHV